MNQAYLFLIFILNGVLIGLVFDSFRVLRRTFKTPNFVTYLEDIFFWIIATFIVLYSLFLFNNGQFRAYIFIGILLGIAIYMLFFSKTIMSLSVKIISVIKGIIIFVIKIISYPLNIIYKFFYIFIIMPVTKSIKIMTKFFKSISKNTKKPNKNEEILQNKEGF